VLYLCNHDVELWISLIGPHNFPGSNNGEFNFDHALFFALQRLDSTGMRLKPEQAVYKGKNVFIWLPTGFGKVGVLQRDTIPHRNNTVRHEL